MDFRDWQGEAPAREVEGEIERGGPQTWSGRERPGWSQATLAQGLHGLVPCLLLTLQSA